MSRLEKPRHRENFQGKFFKDVDAWKARHAGNHEERSSRDRGNLEDRRSRDVEKLADRRSRGRENRISDFLRIPKGFFKHPKDFLRVTFVIFEARRVLKVFSPLSTMARKIPQERKKGHFLEGSYLPS
ncbi:MAG: hypothetical protein QCI82_00880 [Candidatus Thermoplasmatota archaeon]|nr:hypothetical protein [Candidatus Thermoplasmatota archaeon]